MPEILQQLRQLLTDGFENPEQLRGNCQLIITEPDRSLPLAIEFSPGLTTSEAWLDQPQATLQIPLKTALEIIEQVEFVDYRDPEIIGQITLSGELDRVNHVAKALLRPSTDTRLRLETATQANLPSYRDPQVIRLSDPSELQILEALAASQPIIITDLALDTDWNLDRLEKEYGEVPLRVRSAESRETVAEFIGRIKDSEQLSGEVIEGHTKAYTEGSTLPEPMRDAFMPNHFTLHDYIEPQIWLGSVPTGVPASSLHRDPLDGFLYQLIGRKKLLLFPPDQAELLYPMKAYNNYQPCWINPEAPDLARFPKFAKAKPLEVVLNPGELLVQPAGWFHAVYCLDSPTFSVSYFLRH